MGFAGRQWELVRALMRAARCFKAICVRPDADAVDVFSAQDSAGDRVFTVDSTNKRVIVWDGATPSVARMYLYNSGATAIIAGGASGVVGIANTVGGSVYLSVSSGQIDIGRAAFGLEISPATDILAASTLGRRSLRWPQVYQGGVLLVEDWLLGGALADYPVWTGGGTAAPAPTAGADRGVLACAPGIGINNTSTLIADTLSLTRAVAPAVEHVCNMSSVTNIRVRVGLSDTTGFSDDACVAEFDTGVDATTWQLVGYSAGVRTVGTPGTDIIPVANTYQRVEVEVAADGSATLYVNGTSRTTIAAGAVGATAMAPVLYVEHLAGGTSYTLRSDRITVRATAAV